MAKQQALLALQFGDETAQLYVDALTVPNVDEIINIETWAPEHETPATRLSKRWKVKSRSYSLRPDGNLVAVIYLRAVMPRKTQDPPPMGTRQVGIG